MKTRDFVIVILIITVITIFVKMGIGEVEYVQSDIDNRKYLVRSLPDKKQAANLLARIRTNIMDLTKHLEKHKDTKYKKYKPYIEQLAERIITTKINESRGNEVYTSYSVNKGEQIVFCLRSKTFVNKLHDLNLMMYVALHEIAHVACPEYDHTPLFKDIFAFITNVSVELDFYQKIDFPMDHKEYCGIMITESII